MSISYVRPDGITLHPGEWLDIGQGIGKFAGIWENPRLGLMTSLKLYRSREKPSNRTALWMSLPGCEGELDNAKVVDGPLKASGAEPKAKALPRMDRPGWKRDMVATAMLDGNRVSVTGWIRGSFGVSPYLARTTTGGKSPAAALTHIRTGGRFATFENASLAAEMAEIAERIAAWDDLGTIEELGSPNWADAAARVFKAWAQVGIGQVIDHHVANKALLVRRSNYDDDQPRSLQ